MTDLAIKSPNIGYLVFPSPKTGYPPLEAFRGWLFAAVAKASADKVKSTADISVSATGKANART